MSAATSSPSSARAVTTGASSPSDAWGHGVHLGDHVLGRVRRRSSEQPVQQGIGQVGGRATSVQAGHHGHQRLAGQPHGGADVADQPARAVGLPHHLPVDDGSRTCPGARDQHDAGRLRRPGGKGREQVGDHDRGSAQPDPLPGLGGLGLGQLDAGGAGAGHAEHPRAHVGGVVLGQRGGDRLRQPVHRVAATGPLVEAGRGADPERSAVAVCHETAGRRTARIDADHQVHADTVTSPLRLVIAVTTS